MPVVISPNKLYAKNQAGTDYLTANVISDQTTAEQCAAIEAKGVATRASIPSDYTTLSDSVSDLKSALCNLIITSNAELNKIIRHMYIPSSVTIDLSTVNRVTVYNGYSSLYGFRFFNSSNTRLLDFTKSSTFTGIVKIGSVYADIGDLSDIGDTSKNYYCSVYESAKDMKEFFDANVLLSSIKNNLASEFSTGISYVAGQQVWHNGEIRLFTANHPAGEWSDSDNSSVITRDGLAMEIASLAYMFSRTYDQTSTYKKGDYCILNNSVLYKCKEDIDVPESFTVSKWERVFITDSVKLHDSLLKNMVLTSDPELNRIIKRLYIPSGVSVDLTSVTRVTVYNGFSNLYGFRFFNASNQKVLEFAKLNKVLSGYVTVSYCYAEIGDLSIINGTSKNYYCSVYETPRYDTGLYDDFIASQNTEDTSICNYTPSAQERYGQNTGDTVTVMSYNVAHYNDDVAAEIIPDGKIHAFIKTVGNENADFICVQEDREYIDSNDIRQASEYLYYPQYPNSINVSECTVKSKKEADGGYGTVVYSNGRWLTYGVFTIGQKKLLVCSTHPVASYNGTGAESDDSIAARLTEYTEALKWANGVIDLYNQSSEAVHVPEHTHTIIGMDANCITASDKTNLSEIASEYGYIMTNGNRLGWLNTCKSGDEWISIDNILVSDNIIINSVEVLSSKYTDLYSDHVPMVAKLTLLES